MNVPFEEIFDPFVKWCNASRGPILRPPPRLDLGLYWSEWYGGNHPEGITPDQRQALTGIVRKQPEALANWLLQQFLPRYMLGHEEAVEAAFVDLSRVLPFQDWGVFRDRQVILGGGVRAPIVPEISDGRAVSTILESVAIPCGQDSSGFRSDQFKETALNCPWRVALQLPFWMRVAWLAGGRLRGRGLLIWARDALWLVSLCSFLALLWLLGDDAALIAVPTTGVLWSAALAGDLAVGVWFWFSTRRDARFLRQTLKSSLIRVRLKGPSEIEGNSAAAALALSAMGAAFRAFAGRYRGALAAVLRRFEAGASAGDITGRLSRWGWILPVVLNGKTIPRSDIPTSRGLLKPFWSGGDNVANRLPHLAQPPSSAQVGYATDADHRPRGCFHVAQAVLMISGDWSYARLARNVAALLFSICMFQLLPDARCIVKPPAPPAVVPPSGRAPGSLLWVTIETPRPNCFCIRFDSMFWAGRRIDVKDQNNGTGKAELPLVQRPHASPQDSSDGEISIDLRRHIWFREFSNLNDGKIALKTVDGMQSRRAFAQTGSGSARQP